MRLSRIYIDSVLSVGMGIVLPITTSHYIKNVLRLKNGQNIILFNGRETIDYTAQIEISNKKIVATPISATAINLESPLQTLLLQAIGKPEHLDIIIQKVTELGISQIHLFNSERTQTHLKGPRLNKKMAHWHGIINSACEQCGRNIPPTLNFHPIFSDCLKEIPVSNKILLDFNGVSVKQLNKSLDPALAFSMLVGAEGGLTVDEIQLAKDYGFKTCALGSRILRMETAAISITNIIQHHFGDMR